MVKNNYQKTKIQDKKENKGINLNKPFVQAENSTKGITLIVLVITIMFSYDEVEKRINSKGFLLCFSK